MGKKSRQRRAAGGLAGGEADAVTRQESPWAKTAVRTLLLLMAVLSLLYTICYSTMFFNLADEGVTAMGAWRIVQGQVPYRDFFEIVPPVSLYAVAAFVRALGVTVLALRLPAVILAGAMLLLTDQMLRSLSAGWVARVAALSFLTPFGVSYWPNPSHHWFSTVFQLLSMLALLKGEASARPVSWGVLAGASASLSALSLQDQGAYFAIAVTALFFPFAARETRPRLFLGWLAGGIAAAALILLPVLLTAGPADIWYQWIAWPAKQYRQLPGNNFGLKEMMAELRGYGAGWGESPGTTSLLFGNTLLQDALPALGWLSLALVGLRRWVTSSAAGLLAAGLVSATGGLAHRIATTNIIWVAPFLLLPVLVACSKGIGSPRATPRAAAFALAGFVAVAPLLYALYISVKLVTETAAITCPAGTLRYFTDAPESTMEQLELLKSLEAAIPAGAPLAARGFIPLANFLTRHPNPTAYNFIIHPNYHTDEQARRFIGTLESEKVEHLVMDRKNTGASFIIDYLQKNYPIAWRNGDYMVVRRRQAALESGG